MRTTTVHALRVLQQCCGELVGLYTEQAELVDQFSATDPVEWINAELLVIRARLEKAKHECRSLKTLLGIDLTNEEAPG